MKTKLFFSILLLAFFTVAYSQAPNSFNYQAVARDLSGNVMKNQAVKIKISILKASVSGETVYSEVHSITTNGLGLINLEIGTGNSKTGTIDGINWGTDKYFLQIEMDKDGGNDYSLIGKSQLLSVPYSLFSGNGVQFDMNLVCDENTEGMIRYNSDDKVMEYCDGTSWLGFGNSSHNVTCGENLTDTRDGQIYPTVKIGNQCWMAKNLNYGKYNESVFHNDAEGHSDVSNNGIVEKYAFDNDISNFALYGGLYDWNEMMNYNSTEGGKGICPDGWHVPTKDELDELVETVGGRDIAGKQLMTGGSSGFNFELGGERLLKGGFSNSASEAGGLWTSSANPTDNKRATHFYFTKTKDNIASHSAHFKVTGHSVRCIKD